MGVLAIDFKVNYGSSKYWYRVPQPDGLFGYGFGCGLPPANGPDIM